MGSMTNNITLRLRTSIIVLGALLGNARTARFCRTIELLDRDLQLFSIPSPLTSLATPIHARCFVTT